MCGFFAMTFPLTRVRTDVFLIISFDWRPKAFFFWGFSKGFFGFLGNTYPSFPSISCPSLRDSSPSSAWPSTSLCGDVCGMFMWPPVGSFGDPPFVVRSRRRAHVIANVRDAVHHIIRESRQHARRERTASLPSSTPGGRGGRVDIAISDATVGQTLVDIVVADPTRRYLVERAAIHDLVAATYAERSKETHYRDRGAETKFVRVSRSICYDSIKLVVDTLRPLMYPMRLMAEAINGALRQEKLCGSHALHLDAMAMYMT